jgi:hypothetical protein
MRDRFLIAIAAAVLAALLLYAVTIRHPSVVALDYTWHWRAAVALLNGENPYRVIQPTGHYPYSSGYYYPLPAAFLAVPFTMLKPNVAAAIGVGLATFVFALAVTRDSIGRWPVLLSGPMFGAVVTGQVAVPLIAAGFIWPATQLFAITKPNLGLAIGVARPTKWSIVGGAVGATVAFLLVPTWVAGWVAVVRGQPGAHPVPVLVPGGFLVLLALLRWRRPDARLLVVMSLIPQTMTFYDTLPVVLCARTFRQSLVIGLTSQLAMLLAIPYAARIEAPLAVLQRTAWFAVVGVYLPALYFVLRAPEMPVPGPPSRESPEPECASR